MKSVNRRLKTIVELRMTVDDVDGLQERRRKEGILGNVDAVARGHENVIDVTCGAVVQGETHAATVRNGGGDEARCGNANGLATFVEPSCCSRANGPLPPLILKGAGKATEQVGASHKMAKPGLPNVRRRVEHSGNRLEGVEPFLTPEPAHKRSADEDLYIRSGFVEQRSGFQGALATANDHDFFFGKGGEVAVVARMRGQFMRNVLELFRVPCEGLDSCRDDHAASLPNFATFGGETKAGAIFFHAFDLSGVGVRHGLGLKPAAVVDEAIQRQRGSDGVSSRRLVTLQGEILIRVGEVGTRQRRAKKHEFGHMSFPERHGLAKNADVQSIGGFQMSGG